VLMLMLLVSIVSCISHLASLINKQLCSWITLSILAYAESCCDKTVIVNRKNAPGENMLTKDMVAGMNFREFAETVSHKWYKDSGIGTEQTDEPTAIGL